MKIELMNPVLFMISERAENTFGAGIENFLADKTDNRALGFLPLAPPDLSRQEQAFLDLEYKRPAARRINMLFDFNEEIDLSPIIDKIMSFYKPFNLSLFIDVYAFGSIFDNNPERDKNIAQIKELYRNKKIHMPYLFSDINNMRVKVNFEDIGRVICFQMLLKDCSSKSGNPYNERNFIENASLNHDLPFFFIGYKNFGIDRDSLNSVIMNAMITYLKEKPAAPLPELNYEYIFNEEFFSLNDIYPIMTEEQVSSYYINSDIIHGYFSDRADLFFDYNTHHAKEVLNERITGNNTSFKVHVENSIKTFGLYPAIKMLESFAAEAIKAEFERAELALKEAQYKTDEFLKGTSPQTSKNYHYTVLHEYYLHKARYFYCSKIRDSIADIADSAKNYIKELKELAGKTEGLINESMERANQRLGKSSVMKVNFIEYYTNLTYKYLETNESQLYNQVYSYLNTDTAYEKLKLWADKIINSPKFSLDFYSEINSRILYEGNSSEYKTADHVLRLINKEIFEDKLYFYNLYNTPCLYEVVCCISEETINDSFHVKDINGMYAVYMAGAIL